jgi:pimeloyl-ACP methyl ester carboxylesterase
VAHPAAAIFVPLIFKPIRIFAAAPWYPVDPTYVGTPTAFGVFAHQTVPEGEPPRSYLERLYNIQRWTVFARGGHFAPVEEPAATAGDLTAFFRDLSSVG